MKKLLMVMGFFAVLESAAFARIQQNQPDACVAHGNLETYAKALFKKESPSVQLTGTQASLFKKYITAGELSYAKNIFGKKDDFGRVRDEKMAAIDAKGSIYGAMFAVKLADADCKKALEAAKK